MDQDNKEFTVAQEIETRIARFKKFRRKGQDSRLMSIETQFIHMAQGGDGTAAMEGEIRKNFYPRWTNQDFRVVCDELGWNYENK